MAESPVRDKRERILIIGGSSAAISAVEAIRSRDGETEVTMVTKEKHLPYTPTVLPYFVKGKVDEKNLLLRDRNFFEEKKITLVSGEEVIAVDPAGRKVFTKSGRHFDFDKLLIATGAIPIVPPINGANHERVVVFRTVEDAKKIRALSEKAEKVGIVGAGLVGMQLAETLSEKGIKVTVIESESQVLPRNYDKSCAEMIEKIFTGRGVEILTHCRVVSIEPAEGGISVLLDDGRTVSSGFLVLGIGTRPAIDFIKESGIACNKGILVDDSMRTNYPDIYAAGDVAEAKDFFGEEKILNQLLPDAAEQGKIAGLNMLGEERRYEGGISMTTFNFFDSTAFSLGIIHEQPNKHATYSESSPEKSSYKKLVFDGDRLVGAIFLNKNVNISLLVNYLKKKIDYPLKKEEIDSDFETVMNSHMVRSR